MSDNGDTRCKIGLFRSGGGRCYITIEWPDGVKDQLERGFDTAGEALNHAERYVTELGGALVESEFVRNGFRG